MNNGRDHYYFESAPLPLWKGLISGAEEHRTLRLYGANRIARQMCGDNLLDAATLFGTPAVSQITAAAESAAGTVDSIAVLTEIKTDQQQRLPATVHISGCEQQPDGSTAFLLGAVIQPLQRDGQDEDHRLLARLPDANPDTVIILKCAGLQVSYLNPAGKRLLKELKLSERKQIFTCLPDDFSKDICDQCRSEKKKKIISRSYRRYGRHFVMKVRPFEDECSCMITLTDVSEIYRIKQEKELYYEAIQSLQQPLIITDRRGAIVEVNRAFSELYGFDRSEVLGKNPRILNPGSETYYNLGYTAEQYRKLFQQMWRAILKPGLGYWEGELVNRKKDGTLVWINLLINAVRFKDVEAGERPDYFIALPVDITRTRTAVNRSKVELYQTIANLAELRDNETGNHMRRVGLFARLLAQAAGENDKFCDDIEIFAPLHDIGKVGISDSILLAPRSLSEQEFETMKQHTSFGYRIVEGVHGMMMAAEIILNHHERWDGSGYPNGIHGKQIPLSARIATVADVYDALRSPRPYKQPWSREKTEQLLSSASGKHFDPELIKIFFGLTDKFDKVYQELHD